MNFPLLTLIFILFLQTSAKDISTCSVKGDPHLIPFVKYAGAPLSQGYWCRRAGKMTVLTNQYIEVYVYVTAAPFWNENYEIKLKSGPSVLCTLTSTNNECDHPSLDVFRPRTGDGFDIVYSEADDLHVVVTEYSVGNRRVYDIQIEQSFELIGTSQGLCMQMTSACRLESVWGRRRRSIDQSTAVKVCAEYMKQANITAKALAGNTGSPLVKHAEEACINDVYTTSKPEWGESAISFVILDAIKEAKLSKIERRNKMGTVFTAISSAAQKAQEKANLILNSPICAHC